MFKIFTHNLNVTLVENKKWSFKYEWVERPDPDGVLSIDIEKVILYAILLSYLIA